MIATHNGQLPQEAPLVGSELDRTDLPSPLVQPRREPGLLILAYISIRRGVIVTGAQNKA